MKYKKYPIIKKHNEMLADYLYKMSVAVAVGMVFGVFSSILTSISKEETNMTRDYYIAITSIALAGTILTFVMAKFAFEISKDK